MNSSNFLPTIVGSIFPSPSRPWEVTPGWCESFRGRVRSELWLRVAGAGDEWSACWSGWMGTQVSLNMGYTAILPYPPKRQFSTLTGKILWVEEFELLHFRPRAGWSGHQRWAELFGGEQSKNLTGSFRQTKNMQKINHRTSRIHQLGWDDIVTVLTWLHQNSSDDKRNHNAIIWTPNCW